MFRNKTCKCHPIRLHNIDLDAFGPIVYMVAIAMALHIYARVSSNIDFYRGFIANIEPRRVLAGKLAG